MTINVFIYGTLLPGECNAHAAAAYTYAAVEGSIAGWMVDCGLYPAAIPAAYAAPECKKSEEALRTDCTIRGLWITVDRAGLAALDELEEFYGVEERNDYERVVVSDKQRREHVGWAYVWTSARGCPAIDGEFWPDYRMSRDRRNPENSRH